MIDADAGRLVHILEDGRPFITDMSCAESDDLKDIVSGMSNHWQRHEVLHGWVGPAPETGA